MIPCKACGKKYTNALRKMQLDKLVAAGYTIPKINEALPRCKGCLDKWKGNNAPS